MMALRQIASIVILPFTVTVLIPIWIGGAFRPPERAVDYVSIAAGVAAAVAGLSLFVSTVYLFWTRGRGTLAPWDPPRVFVAAGPYRYVRNPMISGVILILVAEALVFRSTPFAEWAATFFAINLIYIPLLEEPMLDARFGESYRTYKRNVRKFLPRLSPWQQ